MISMRNSTTAASRTRVGVLAAGNERVLGVDIDRSGDGDTERTELLSRRRSLGRDHIDEREGKALCSAMSRRN